MELSERLRPRIRRVEAFPIAVPNEQGNKRLLCLRDPSHVSPHLVGLQPPALFLVGLLDGEHSPKAIQEKFLVRYGEVLGEEDLQAFLDNLEQSLMLEGPTFEAHKARLEAAWEASAERPMQHQDGGYGGPMEGLQGRLQGYFISEHSPGSATGSALPPGSQLRGLIAPHIDFARGGPTYAWAYRELQAAPTVETVVVLGTSHVPLSQAFSLCGKPFSTPFGRLEVDQEFVESLRSELDLPLTGDPLVHAHEHSIELQAVWLASLQRERPLRIVPILCGALDCSRDARGPADTPEVEAFVRALARVTASHPRRTVLLAAADLAHVGTGFGDRVAPSQEDLGWIEKADRESLHRACARDAEGLYAQMRQEEDVRRVCGLAPIYAMVRALEPCEGSLLAYRQCVDPQGFRTVTIASAAFYQA